MTLPIPVGIQLSLDGTTWYKLSDHNRSPIALSYDITEQSQRMANGKMRKYVIANKLKISTDWKDLPTLDSNLVDYSGTSTTTTVSAAPTNTSFIPAPAISTQAFTSTSVVTGGQTNITLTGSIPPVNSIVTLSGIPTAAPGRIQNGTYVVSSVAGSTITITTPGVTVGSTGLSATLTWINGTSISLIIPANIYVTGGSASDTWFTTNLTNAQLTSLVSVGTAITIFGASNNLYNNTFTIAQVSGNAFLVTGLTSPNTYVPSAYSTYFITGTYSNPGSTSNVPTTYTTYTSTFGAAWIKAFYESNVFFPVQIKLTFAQDTDPTLGSMPSPTTYKDSFGTTGQIVNAFITSFSYDVSKRRIGSTSLNNSLANSPTGYDLVDVKIEFTEI